MELKQTSYEHVGTDASGTAYLIQTNIKVVELVMEHLAYGWSPEELHFQHPRLSLGQIHSALAYYWDHHALLDDNIEARRDRAESLASQIPEPGLVQRLKHRTVAWGLRTGPGDRRDLGQR